MQTILKEVKNTYPEGSDVVMTLAEYYMEKGMEKGRIEGIKLGTINSICSLLTKKFGDIPEEIHEELNSLPLSALEKILEIFSKLKKWMM